MKRKDKLIISVCMYMCLAFKIILQYTEEEFNKNIDYKRIRCRTYENTYAILNKK
jgi:hypothetical protein